MEEIRGNVDREIEEKRLKTQNEAQKDKEKHLNELEMIAKEQAHIQKNIEFLKAEEEKLLKNIVGAVENTYFDEEEINILLAKENLLDEYFDKWMRYDCGEMQDYLDFSDEVKYEILSKILDERPKKSLLERAEEIQKEKSIGYEPEM